MPPDLMPTKEFYENIFSLPCKLVRFRPKIVDGLVRIA
jgi:hypothetical protein